MISFFGINGFPENNMDEISTAIHKIVIKSVLEIVQSLKQRTIFPHKMPNKSLSLTLNKK